MTQFTNDLKDAKIINQMLIEQLRWVEEQLQIHQSSKELPWQHHRKHQHFPEQRWEPRLSCRRDRGSDRTSWPTHTPLAPPTASALPFPPSQLPSQSLFGSLSDFSLSQHRLSDCNSTIQRKGTQTPNQSRISLRLWQQPG